MEHKKIQKEINDIFTEAFSHTPLSDRLKDIQGECRELVNFTDVKNLEEETGDLLASVIQLCNESGWDIVELLEKNKRKIYRRMPQYKSLGRKTNVAILGGAFNPPTKGHVSVAKLILDVSRWADEVWFMPAYKHLDGKEMVDVKHRLEMLEYATKGDPRMKVSDYEIEHKLGGETYHLLNKLTHDAVYENYRFSFIIGLDRANTIENWYKSDELLNMDVPFIVVTRNGYMRDIDINWYLQEPHKYIKSEIKESEIVEISSTTARELIEVHNLNAGGFTKIDEVLNKDVTKYIFKNKLYMS